MGDEQLTPDLTIPASEAISLGATDNLFFTKTFFPKTVRQAPPSFHPLVWNLLESSSRYINLLMFRGSAKTSTCRLYTAKRFAYGFARTVLYVGKSEGHALRSVRWLRRQVELNTAFTQVFKLEPGKKWQDHECEIYHGLQDHTATIIALGITGSVRGVNIDDYRPDLIVLDDVLDEENSATPEQREKTEKLVYGALMNSLTPATEAPDAKLVALNTPQNGEDFSIKALDDAAWKSVRVGCFTPATADLPLHEQVSSWPERYPTEVLRQEKLHAINRNKLSIFLREMEVKISSPETSAFLSHWIKYADKFPPGCVKVLAIDPVPPPSDKQINQGFKDKDYEALVIVGRKGKDFYIGECSVRRGHEPGWTIAEFFRLAQKYQPRRVVVETVAYQRTLMWILRQAMNNQRKWYVIKEFEDKRRKYDRIVDAIGPIGSNGNLYIVGSNPEFESQFRGYPDVKHDDIIDAVAMAIIELAGQHVFDDPEDIQDEDYDDESRIPELEYVGAAP